MESEKESRSIVQCEVLILFYSLTLGNMYSQPTIDSSTIEQSVNISDLTKYLPRLSSACSWSPLLTTQRDVNPSLYSVILAGHLSVLLFIQLHRHKVRLLLSLICKQRIPFTTIAGLPRNDCVRCISKSTKISIYIEKKRQKETRKELRLVEKMENMNKTKIRI